MSSLLLTALLTTSPALAKKPKPMPPLVPQVHAWIAQVDALHITMTPSPALVIFTVDELGGPLTLRGPEGLAALNGMLAEWKGAEGTITTKPSNIECLGTPLRGVCTAEYHQTFTQKGEPAGAIDVRASLVFAAQDGEWVLLHVHESAPTSPIAPPQPPPTPPTPEQSQE